MNPARTGTRAPRLRRGSAALLSALWLAACGGDDGGKPADQAGADAAVDSAADADSGDAAPADAPPADGVAVDASGDVQPAPPLPPMDCDDLMPSGCALPWPSNLYLVADAKRKTGYTLAFGAKSLPKDSADQQIRPDEYRQLDGFSVGTPLLMKWPDLDAAGLPSEASLANSLDAKANVALLELDAAGKVVRALPWFAELDLNEPVEAERTLIVRPAELLRPATRYVVGVRGLKTKDGKALTPSAAFAQLRDGATAGTANAGRQARFDQLLAALEAHGWPRGELLLAWDFVTNSHPALHGRMLSMREQLFAAMGDQSLGMKITEVKSFTEQQDKNIALEFHGTFEAPNFLVPRKEYYHRLNLGADGMPVPQGLVERPFEVRVPRSALGGSPHGLVQYGHGLNGSYREVEAGYNGDIANTHKLIFYSAYWTGMSEKDVPAILMAILDMSEFAVIPERLQQGFLEFLALQRAMKLRFATLPEVKQHGIVVNPAEMFYSGISQGGIFGGSIAALSKDITRFHLGVPGNNYSLLLQRSSDFTGFFGLVAGSYPKSVDQQLLLATIQLLWDQADPASWYRSISQEPLPGNPPHQVLLAPAKGDYQVAVLANEIAARSGLGMPLMAGYGKAVYGAPLQPFPHQGSGIVLYDHGNPWPAPGNLPPLKDALGDPHGKPRKLAHHQAQMVHFFRTGEIKDVCGGDGCTPD